MSLEYVGGGFIPGIPARDLTNDEVKEYGGERYLIGTRLYQKPSRVAGTPKDKKAVAQDNIGDTDRADD